ncbi:hypothetical protein MPSEU_000102600 [Mayamaea pseudoterrestris]|nr:hypothetical protein MPSEU_000102600 [Mayamaea pseudoterrestris]
MGYSNKDTDDFEKLRIAFVEITSKFGSIDALLEAMGLSDMPTAQRYGILFGCLVFVSTVSAVVALLIMGGSFQRIKQQAETGETTIVAPHDARSQRPLLLETLLDARERMMQNCVRHERMQGSTKLMSMLANVAPENRKVAAKDLLQHDESKGFEYYIPPMYQENYYKAYRTCQDKPGGATLPGRPESRFEAYARGFAGCGPYVSDLYRRSYGRMYEAICCANHKTDDKYLELWKTRPADIVGRYVRLEALDDSRHLKELYTLTSGEPGLQNKAFDPEEVWSFQPEGPFKSDEEMAKSFVFQHMPNEAAFAIVHAVTDRLMGAFLLTNDDPKNLTIQIEPPLMQAAFEGCPEQLEAIFLMMDRLYGYGYRRIQICIDSQDVHKRKLATRLGFTVEGMLFKHKIVKESSRDSNIYSMLNSDWNKGARAALFTKLYGALACKVDAANEKKEEELEEQNRQLVAKKLKEAEEAESSKLKHE